MPSVSNSVRLVLTVGLLVLALGGCGRRGPLESPLTAEEAAVQRQREEARRQRQGEPLARPAPTGAAVAGQTEIPAVATARRSEANPPVPDEDEGDELPSNIAPTPIPTPQTGKRRGYVIPKDPFILDPLL
jgi:predicted small lipoprotein YifL